MKKQKLYSYLINIRNFLKYGFTDENVSVLGMSKLEKNQGKNDGELCALAYELPKYDCILAGSRYGIGNSSQVKRNSLENSSYSLVKRKEEK